MTSLHALNLRDSAWERIADPAPGPEELLIAKEESGSEDETCPRATFPASRAKLREALARLPEAERQVLEAHYAGGQSQRTIGARMGLPQNLVWRRIHEGTRRLRWIMRDGAFTTNDLERDTRDRLTRLEMVALCVYWEQRTWPAVHAEFPGRAPRTVERLVRHAVEKLPHGRYRRGFESLMSHAKDRLLEPLQGPARGLAEFFRYRCVFAPSARVAKVTLLAAHERDALTYRYAPTPPTLLRALALRGIRSVRVRTSWASSTPGFAGVALVSPRA
jgi:hypothetical protein